ncbi:MAG: restriction endonuclease [Magnetococcales bacterium]|nr:restriction endonuclease [Magnetococcales bacterium]
MAKIRFTWEQVDHGIALRLEQKKILGTRIIPVDEWINTIEPNRLFAVGHLLRLLEEEEQTPLLAKKLDDRLWLRHSVVAGLPDAKAQALNLPDSTSLTIGLQSRGNISQPHFSITAQWLESNSIPAWRTTVEGCILKYNGQVYRIPEPLFSIWHGVAQFNEAAGGEDSTRFAHLATLRELIPDRDDSGVNADAYIRNTRIVHAAAFSLHLHTGLDGFQVDPVLFARGVKKVWVETDGEASISEAEGLLPEALQEVFAKDRFAQWNECRDRYGLGNHHYVYIEPGLQQALTVVRRVQISDAETRRRFARNPQAYLKNALGDTADIVDHLFIATEQYSQRVVDLGVWQSVVLPWIKREANSWLPERFGIQVGKVRIELNPKEIEPARRKVTEAMARGDATARIADHDIPANQETMKSLDPLMGFAEPDVHMVDHPPNREEETERAEITDKPMPSAKLFLIVDENYEAVSYHRNLTVREANDVGGIPLSLLTALKPHQEEGLNWLQSAWRVGFPGVLLADDMGLGKTLLALTFLQWMTDRRAQLGLERLPTMVVAPTGLLANWNAEHERHLSAPGLGVPLRAYGHELKRLRVDDKRGRDVDLGQPLLDTSRLQEADWILTTFETLRDYHHSFAKVRLASAVYDEAQKIKNPTSQLARAAKTVNADFNLTMTGTPVENRLEDLWAIMDVAYPGYLGDMKSFSTTYPPEEIAALKRLRAIMLDPIGEVPPVMIRRMKIDKLEGLPEKRTVPLPRPMPKKQADSYAEVVTRGRQASGPGAMLETLHAMRGVSLHPIDPQQAHGIPHDDYIAWSARLAATFEILRKVANAREKALIFVESLDMQETLATMLKREFHLPKLPMLINGRVSGEERQKAVDTFQKCHGEFDVMILSPKAGGVGLTLTAANHVIHLSRWWNPAVEDQCTDRIYRIGQGKRVTVYYPMAVHPGIEEHSFDIQLDALLEKKRALSRDLLVPPVLAGADQSTLFRETVGRIGDGQKSADDPDLDELDRMTPKQFENWVLRRLQAGGYRLQRTPQSKDGGADGIAVHSQTGALLIIQCKQRQGPYCDASPIDDLLRARTAYDGHEHARLMAVTTAKNYTAQAQERANRHGIELIAREALRGFPHLASGS